MLRSYIYIILILTVSLPFERINAQSLDIKGMAAGWLTAGHSNEWAIQMGGRYIPELNFQVPLKEGISFDGEFSANLAGSYTTPSAVDKYYGKIKPYRMWMKVSGNQFEIRAGLQKINFGSATFLRPLMWFDQIDPRDPLQLTDGVYGILGRYYTLNNLNIWLWSLYGNKNTKGWETYKTFETKPEWGGRIQIPVPRAEIGISYHNRDAVLPSTLTGYGYDLQFSENRLGIDIRADLELGLWLEDVVKHQDHNWMYPYTNMLTMGADYTLGIGSGLNITAEHFNYRMGSDLFGSDMEVNFTGMSLRYSLSIIASINAIMYYDWTNKELYRFINAGLSFDRFSYYLMGFWNPEQFRIYEIDSGPSLFNGAGFQIMIVYNH